LQIESRLHKSAVSTNTPPSR